MALELNKIEMNYLDGLLTDKWFDLFSKLLCNAKTDELTCNEKRSIRSSMILIESIGSKIKENRKIMGR